MKAHDTSPHPAIAQITDLITEHHSLAKDFAADQTLPIAEAALESAKAAVTEAELEDDSIDPEALVDKRIEARRNVEVAQIRLERAKKVIDTQASCVMEPIRKGGSVAAEALREVVEPFAAALEAELRRVIGQQEYESDQGRYKALIYRKGERILGHARLVEKASSIALLNQSIELINDATRLG